MRHVRTNGLAGSVKTHSVGGTKAGEQRVRYNPVVLNTPRPDWYAFNAQTLLLDLLRQLLTPAWNTTLQPSSLQPFHANQHQTSNLMPMIT